MFNLFDIRVSSNVHSELATSPLPSCSTLKPIDFPKEPASESRIPIHKFSVTLLIARDCIMSIFSRAAFIDVLSFASIFLSLCIRFAACFALSAQNPTALHEGIILLIQRYVITSYLAETFKIKTFLIHNHLIYLLWTQVRLSLQHLLS